MTTVTIKVPDIGDAEGVEVIELCVVPGDSIELEQPLIVLESDKASIEIPSPQIGTVIELLVDEGATLSEGDAILTMEVSSSETAETNETKVDGELDGRSEVSLPEPEATEAELKPELKPELEPETESAAEEQLVAVPDTGGADNIEVIEVCVSVGEEVEEGASLIVVESDKASMEIPAPFAGKITELLLKEGDEASEGTAIVKMLPSEAQLEIAAPVTADWQAASLKDSGPPITTPKQPASTAEVSDTVAIYAGPAVRKLARELGVDLNRVKGSGPKSRILKEDVQKFVQKSLSKSPTGASAGSGIPPIADVDFAKFGELDIQPMSKLHKMTSVNMHRNWLNVPHVTQFDDADITNLEEFRQEMKAEAERRAVKLTPLPFLLKASATALRDNPGFNVSLMSDGERIVFKKYINIGIAVATPEGLVVPVVKGVDKKNLWQLAEETADLAEKARARKLRPDDMQGGCFTISSLGNIGGTGFTPIINAPEVAILGVSKLALKPLWDGEVFQPRKMLPLSLSYDHRAINGADAGKFFTELGALLADVRKLLL